jgi:hypothetical protein
MAAQTHNKKVIALGLCFGAEIHQAAQTHVSLLHSFSFGTLPIRD